ncbi:Uncharacterized protein OS=Blastopirellula marina DSM 3645 GN=DSM3645_18016 PE=4 SV=1: PEGA [Gemmataceae bacterium]|nr:Uncharacterized protein OS=Blastopirellula marina DSM 3645 GN=DSM3645_18016 PE=4 SV=1: PEGA [Gemmataceae bacterium]VTT98520.1 Uncharacterized protein OS=Blastopirellula marina DSM 3645 GN=DSM3645_18016 PE=4 SV=1: PEGA [Gemmataceae bacterium]
MATGRTFRAVAVLGVLASAGCVDRRFIIESNVPNAQVYIDDKPVGAAPSHSSFEYYGNYTVTLVQPGYETLTKRVHVRAPWYAYPPFDLLAEVVWPFHIHDTRRYYFELHEATKTRTDDLLNSAEALRLRGQNLPSPERPALPKVRPGPAPVPPQPTDPNVQPFPQPGSGAILPPPRADEPPPGIVPKVGP